MVERRTAELRVAAEAELDDVLSLGGAFEAVETLKSRLGSSMAARTRRIESGEQIVVGVNDFVEAAELGAVGESTRQRNGQAAEDEDLPLQFSEANFPVHQYHKLLHRIRRKKRIQE